MSNVYFITHPEVVIDPDVPVSDWPLSEIGKVRMEKMLAQPWVASIDEIYSSLEQKAMDGAAILSEHLNTTYTPISELGENDRTATGYLPKDEFEAMANEFFQKSTLSVKGWETAVDAQARIVTATNRLIEASNSQGSIAIVSHGAVGTLLLCHLNNWAISRDHDQPGGGGGNYFSFDRETMEVQHGWRPIDIEMA